MNYTLHFHLGPVQSFISEGRRTRDIWAGSFILSWLAAVAFAEAMGKKVDASRVHTPSSFPSDPIFAAVHAARFASGPTGAPVCSTFPNHFAIDVDNKNAGDKAAERLRACWVKLSHAVEALIFDTPLAGGTLGERYLKQRKLFQSQIGTPEFAPFWEIYSVVEKKKPKARKPAPSDVHEPDAMALRKLQRWGADSRHAPLIQNGGFCSMLPGMLEISSSEDLGSSARREFWNAVRNVTLKARYKDEREDRLCLDLAPKEQLSAPALVKRLFPLLRNDILKEVFGWVPIQRSSMIEPPIEEADRRNNGSALLTQIWQSWFGTPTTAPSFKITEEAEEAFQQSASLWPSTSCIAAAHWIERVHLMAPPALTSALRATIRSAGDHLALAEQSLFVPCTRVGLGGGELRSVDGACLFETSLIRMEKEHQEPAFGRIRKILATLSEAPMNPDRPELGTIGRPAPIYAIVRADGDEMGKHLSEPNGEKISKALGQFTQTLRGGGANGDIGTIASNNGITLYASADEMIAMCPLEDAFPLAKAVQQAFMNAMASYQQKDKELTLSVAITFAHHQIPLGWVMQSGVRLLNGVAKEQFLGHTLAVEFLDAGGRSLQWVAPWKKSEPRSLVQAQNPRLESLEELLKAACGGPHKSLSALGSNQFFHQFAERLAPFILQVDDSSVSRVSDALRRENSDARMIEMPTKTIDLLINHMLREKFDGLAETDRASLVGWIRSVSSIQHIKNNGELNPREDYLSTTGLNLVRFLAGNWRKSVHESEPE